MLEWKKRKSCGPQRQGVETAFFCNLSFFKPKMFYGGSLNHGVVREGEELKAPLCLLKFLNFYKVT